MAHWHTLHLHLNLRQSLLTSPELSPHDPIRLATPPSGSTHCTLHWRWTMRRAITIVLSGTDELGAKALKLEDLGAQFSHIWIPHSEAHQDPGRGGTQISVFPLAGISTTSLCGFYSL